MRAPGSTARVWAQAFRNSLADRSAYRGDFVFTTLATILGEMMTPLVTVLLYQTSGQRGFPGWTMTEALLIQAVFLVSRGIASPFFFSMVWTVNGLVRSGRFELVLLQPRSPLLVCLTRSINVQAFGRLAGGLVLLVWVLVALPPVTVGGWAQFAVLFAASLLVLFAFALFMAATLFVWVGNGRVAELVDSVLVFAQYPVGIFSPFFQGLFTFVLPIAAIAFFPAGALLGREAPLVLPSLAAAGVFFGLGLLFWNRMLKHYAGAGG